MSSVHRIMTGLEFVLDPATGHVNWPAETEDLVRLSLELARVTRSGLAFAAVSGQTLEEHDCGKIDRWLAGAEDRLEEIWRAAVEGVIRVEHAAWFGKPLNEWLGAAQDSEMDLLIVPGAFRFQATFAAGVHSLQADSLLWFVGRELDRLASEPPLIAFCDDLSEEAAVHLPFAVELAMAWGARLLIVHPVGQAVSDMPVEAEGRLRREIFVRLSRTDFRAIPHGSQLQFVSGGLTEILSQVAEVQPPNLVLVSMNMVRQCSTPWSGHVLVWPDELTHRNECVPPGSLG